MKHKIILGLLFIGMLIGLSFYLQDLVILETIKQYRDTLHAFVGAHYYLSLVLYFLLCFVSTMLALPITALLMLLAGFLFGMFVGAVLFIGAATLGSVVVFLWVRYLFHDHVAFLYQEKLQWLDKQIQQYGAYYFLAVRFAALIPFYLENILAGLTTLPLKTYTWTTFMGIIPGAFVYAFAGTQLGKIKTINEVFTTSLIASFIVLGLLVLIPIGIQRYLKKF